MNPETKVNPETTEDTPQTPVAEPKEVTPEVKTVPMEQYQGLQRQIAKHQERIKELEATHASMSEIREEVAKLREDNASLYDFVAGKLPSETEPVEPIKPASRQEALKAERAKREEDTRNRRVEQELAGEIQQLVNNAKLDANDEKLSQARLYWSQGRHTEAVQEVRKVTGNIKEEPKVDIEARITQEVEKRLNEALAKSGLMRFPSGEGSGGGSVDAARSAYARGEITSEEARRRGVRFT